MDDIICNMDGEKREIREKIIKNMGGDTPDSIEVIIGLGTIF